MNMRESEGISSERRRAPRYRYQAVVEIEWGSARLRARTRDISEGGMFIEADDVLWVGAGFRARLPLIARCGWNVLSAVLSPASAWALPLNFAKIKPSVTIGISSRNSRGVSSSRRILH